MMELIDVQTDVTYKNEAAPILSNAKLSVRKGEFVVLCGASGCGKTTLLRCINHLIPDFYEADMKGAVCINGRDISALSIGETGELSATVFQDPRSQFFTTNSTTEIAFGLENKGISHPAVKSVPGRSSENTERKSSVTVMYSAFQAVNGRW
jgi:energy-coupling factor transport system ATP-binding protein